MNCIEKSHQKQDEKYRFFSTIITDYSNMLNWNEIADRFFSLYSNKKQAEIVAHFQTNKASVSHWKNYVEKVPIHILEQTVESEGVTWDWLLEGHEPMHRKPTK